MVIYAEDQPITDVDNRQVITETTAHDPDYGTNVVARVIYLIGGVVISLLGLRFLLALLGANPTNAFANFIYTITYPLASPFFGLFGYDQTLGRSRFEIGTLVAIVVYALITALLVRLVTIGRHHPRPVA